MDDLQRLAERHRRWLGRLGLLDRPWLVLGSAPSPTLPQVLTAGHARIDINNSGLSARQHGLGPADLTFRRGQANWADQPDLRTRGLIWFTGTPTPVLRARILVKYRKARVGSLLRIAKRDRNRLVEELLQATVAGVGADGKPSNGIIAACFGLYHGVPEVVLAGVSLTSDGHAYNKVGQKRQHVAEDGFVLRKFAGNPRIATTEPGLAEATGIRLWTPPR